VEVERLGFFIDEDLPPAIAEILQTAGISATSVVHEKRQGLSDEEQLRYAASRQLVLVTANVADYVELSRQWASRGREHAGLVLVSTKRFPRRDARAIARALRVLAARETVSQLRNSAWFLTQE
jgi:predicted nuclease of predicted toxin-antitoxin system